MKREMSVAGSFYPDSADELKRYFEHFNKILEDNKIEIKDKSRMIIVPHAGYVYSGFTANMAYKVLQNSNIKKFVVIGPSHRVAFEGISICEANYYDTPFGEIKADLDILKTIKKEFSLHNIAEAHFEHSTETQFPFLKYYIKDVEIVELVYSKANSADISAVIDFILAKYDYGIIISTDLSHFYDLEQAKKLDNICLNALNDLDINILNRGCEACGKKGVEAVMLSATKLNMVHKLLDYRTSADFSKDESRVVGYMSGYFQ